MNLTVSLKVLKSAFHIVLVLLKFVIAQFSRPIFGVKNSKANRWSYPKRGHFTRQSQDHGCCKNPFRLARKFISPKSPSDEPEQRVRNTLTGTHRCVPAGFVFYFGLKSSNGKLYKLRAVFSGEGHQSPIVV